MITINIKTDIKGLDAAVKAAANLAPAMASVGQVLRGETLKSFRQGGRTPGEWPTSRRAREKGGRTLVARGMLRNSITTASGADFAQVGTSLIYARIHQQGGTITAKKTITITPKRGKLLSWTGANGKRRFAKSVTQRLLRWKVGDKWCAKPSVTIPRRPFLPVDDAGNLLPTCERRIRAVLMKHFTGSSPDAQEQA